MGVAEFWANKFPEGLGSFEAPRLPKRVEAFSVEPKMLLAGALKRSEPAGMFGLSVLKRIELEGSSIVLPPGPIAVAVFPFFSSFYDFFFGISCGTSGRTATTGSGFGAYTGLFWKRFAVTGLGLPNSPAVEGETFSTVAVAGG